MIEQLDRAGPHGWRMHVPAGPVHDAETGDQICTFTQDWRGELGGDWPPAEIILLPDGSHPVVGATGEDHPPTGRVIAFLQGWIAT